MKEEATCMNMRYPADVYEAIRQYAGEDSRSFHNMVIYILREYIKNRKKGEEGSDKSAA